jgi:LysM repeat protein
LWGVIGVLVVVGVCLLAGTLYYSSMKTRAFNSRPLVLIHNPVNHEQVMVGERVLVHASARADNGLTRLELWSDNTLVATNDAPESHPTNLVISSDWLPTLSGIHVLVVRAVSTNGVEGQATIAVNAIEYAISETGSYIVQEGESLESIADSLGTTPEELEDLNPGIDPGGPEPGDELVVPDTEPGAEEVRILPEPFGDPPPAESNPPSYTGVYSEFLLGVLADIFGGDAERVVLRLEIPSLNTGEAYDNLHCYIELAGSPPQWYPDVDDDQSTDESFRSLGDGVWDTAAYLVGENAPIISWPGNQPLPLTVSCVGIASGTEAFELGSEELNIAPEDWNGVPISLEVHGAEGDYSFTYRITPADSIPRNIPLSPDNEMVRPDNVRLDDRRISLRWDYPDSEEASIDGFRIYLNGSLQWIEPPDARESGLPYEWFNPPCGTRYNFSVTAFRVGFPDGPESVPSSTFVETPEDNCNREIQIIFQTLETFDLGSDGQHEHRDPDVGPPYGYFFANEKQYTFDGGTLERGVGTIDQARGLRHNTVYDIGEMASDPTWNFSGLPSTVVDIPEGGTFQFGYHIMDEDSGRCHHSDDPGCDDLICEGISYIYEDNGFGELDQWHEDTLTSDNGRCRVTYRWGPAFGSPVGTGEVGMEPLPWINFEGMDIDDTSGQVSLNIKNTGTATWSWHDLKVELQSRDGESLGVYTWPRFVLEPGQSTTLEQADMRLSAPYDACVLIDPSDDVLELYERSGAFFHYPQCPVVPDLTVTEARYVPSGGNLGQLTVTIQNIGEGVLNNRSVSIRSYLMDGTPLYIEGSYPGITLNHSENITFTLGGVTESIRERMQDGYKVTVNPAGTILESNADNNTYIVDGSIRISLVVVDAGGPEYFDDSYFTLNASIVSGASAQEIANWNIAPTGPTDGMVFRRRLYDDIQSSYFELMGDEILRITTTVYPERGRYDPMTDIKYLTTADLSEFEDPGFTTGCGRTVGAYSVLAYNDRGYWVLTYAFCRHYSEW